ncbi:hypothetical protein ACTFIZ_005600 [Dictyostelium cf. discoideum]
MLIVSTGDQHGLVLAVLAIVAFVLFHKSNHRFAFHFDIVILAACAGITFAFSSNSVVTQFEYMFDLAVSALVGGCALYALQKGQKYIVYGYLIHAIWDLLHHNFFHIATTKTPYWYPTFCMVYDFFVAFYYFSKK